jgi:hypothetical protein
MSYWRVFKTVWFGRLSSFLLWLPLAAVITYISYNGHYLVGMAIASLILYIIPFAFKVQRDVTQQSLDASFERWFIELEDAYDDKYIWNADNFSAIKPILKDTFEAGANTVKSGSANGSPLERARS